jgi:hypothetical protein
MKIISNRNRRYFFTTLLKRLKIQTFLALIFTLSQILPINSIYADENSINTALDYLNRRQTQVLGPRYAINSVFNKSLEIPGRNNVDMQRLVENTRSENRKQLSEERPQLKHLQSGQEVENMVTEEMSITVKSDYRFFDCLDVDGNKIIDQNDMKRMEEFFAEIGNEDMDLTPARRQENQMIKQRFLEAIVNNNTNILTWAEVYDDVKFLDFAGYTYITGHDFALMRDFTYKDKDSSLVVIRITEGINNRMGLHENGMQTTNIKNIFIVYEIGEGISGFNQSNLLSGDGDNSYTSIDFDLSKPFASNPNNGNAGPYDGEWKTDPEDELLNEEASNIPQEYIESSSRDGKTLSLNETIPEKLEDIVAHINKKNDEGNLENKELLDATQAVLRDQNHIDEATFQEFEEAIYLAVLVEGMKDILEGVDFAAIKGALEDVVKGHTELYQDYLTKTDDIYRRLEKLLEINTDALLPEDYMVLADITKQTRRNKSVDATLEAIIGGKLELKENRENALRIYNEELYPIQTKYRDALKELLMYFASRIKESLKDISPSSLFLTKERYEALFVINSSQGR